jgi:hypothetical protein
MDSLVFAESVDSESSEPIMIDKQWLYINDNNAQSYTGQVVLDTTSLSNSGAYMGWNESFLAIPLVLQMQGSANLPVTSPLDFSLGMKSGFWQILHSMQVEFNNGSVVQTSNFLNVFTSFKCLTSWSDADIRNWGAITGFCPDTSSSWLYNSAANAATNFLSPNGTGFCNNRTAAFSTQVLTTSLILGAVTPATTFADSKQSCVNLGLLQRQKWLSFGIFGSNATYAVASTTGDASANKATLLAGASAGTTNAGLNAIFQSYVQSTAQNRAIIFDAVIRMKDVCDFFNKCPLLKGSTMRIYLNTNQTYFTLNAYGHAISAAGVITPGNLSLASAPIILGGGQTCPIMIASGDLGQGSMAALLPAAGINDAGATIALGTYTIQVAVSIVTTQFSGMTVFTAPVKSIRLYCPAYTMTPQAEARYLAMSPTKKIVYNDFFQYTIPALGPTAFNTLVSNGLPNLRSVLCVPTIDKAGNGTATAASAQYTAITTSSLLSPFSTTGGTPDPIAISNFNLQISGKNAFIQNQQYDYEQFTNQLVSSNQLNGSLTTSLGSGQIGFSDFEQLYRYYYYNAARGSPQDMGVSKSVQVQGELKTSAASVSLLVFLEFERSIVVNVASGQRVE